VTDPAVGPKLPNLFAQNGITPLGVHLFPVSRAQLGAPPENDEPVHQPFVPPLKLALLEPGS